MGTIWSPNAQTPVKQICSSTSGASSITSSVTIRNMQMTSTQGSSSSTGLPQGSRGRYSIAGMKPILVQSSKNMTTKEGNFFYIRKFFTYSTHLILGVFFIAWSSTVCPYASFTFYNLTTFLAFSCIFG